MANQWTEHTGVEWRGSGGMGEWRDGGVEGVEEGVEGHPLTSGGSGGTPTYQLQQLA